MPLLHSITVYPVKSAAGISLTERAVLQRGLAGDRRWMIVNGENEFLSQRTVPHLCLLRVEMLNNGI